MWLCRLFGHRFRIVLTDRFWAPVEQRCVRCGAIGPGGLQPA